jgi:hypothetical protein
MKSIQSKITPESVAAKIAEGNEDALYHSLTTMASLIQGTTALPGKVRESLERIVDAQGVVLSDSSLWPLVTFDHLLSEMDDSRRPKQLLFSDEAYKCMSEFAAVVFMGGMMYAERLVAMSRRPAKKTA